MFSALPDRVLDKLLEETALSIESGDLPVGCALTVDGKLVGSDHNTVRSQNGRRFHAERNLLARLAETTATLEHFAQHPRSGKGEVQVQLVDPAHQRQFFGRYRNGLVVSRRAGDIQYPTLPGNG